MDDTALYNLGRARPADFMPIKRMIADHLRYEHGMPMWQIADRLDIPFKTIKGWYGE